VANTRRPLLHCACALLILSGCSKREPAAPADNTPASRARIFDSSEGTSGMSGIVTLEGPAPAASQIRMDADPVCAAGHKDAVFSEDVIATGGRLANVFVYVKEGLGAYSFPPPEEPVVLAQDGCRYVPHVTGVMVNQKLRIVNNDATLHNIHCRAEINSQFNIGQPVKGMEAIRTFAKPEVMIRFACDVHKWMYCYVGVVAHPFYAVTGTDGAFNIRGLPPGQYVVAAWHEKYGSRTRKVTLVNKESKSVDFSFGGS